MVSELITLVIVVFTILLYQFYIRPKRNYSWYSKTLKGLGYKVCEIPFKPFSFPWFQKFGKSQQEFGDVFYHEKKQFAGYDVILSNIASTPYLIFTSPGLIKQFLLASKNFIQPKRNQGQLLSKVLMGNGLVLSEGQQWKRKRKVLSRLFSFQLIKSNVPHVSKICDYFFKQSQMKSVKKVQEVNGKDDKQHRKIITYEYDLLKTNVNIFGSAMLASFFGEFIQPTQQGTPLYEEANYLLQVCMHLSTDILVLLFGRRAYDLELKKEYKELKQRINKLKEAISNEVTKIKQKFKNKTQTEKQNSTSIIEALIYDKEKSGEEIGYGNQEIVEEFITFIIAGSDTTANFTTMMLFYTFSNKQILQKVLQLIKNIRDDTPIAYEDIKDIEYLNWVQNQTTRAFGPIGDLFIRESLTDQYIKDIPIKKDTAINYLTYPMHYDPNIFIQPHKFRPERWEKQCLNIDPFSLMGFSSGPRNCIGKHMAILFSKVGYVKFLQRYKTLEETQKRIFTYTFITSPKHTNVRLTKIKEQQNI